MSEAISTDLVPFDSQRYVWNALNGTHLEAHGSQLTREQAIAINDCFDIEVVLGTHGDPKHEFGKPTKLEYAAVESVIDRMQCGDTLYAEGYGFTQQPSKPMGIDALINSFGLRERILLSALYDQDKEFEQANLDKRKENGGDRLLGVCQAARTHQRDTSCLCRL